MDMLALLRLQLEWGADEALDEAPLDRLAAPQERPGAHPGASAGLMPALPGPHAGSLGPTPAGTTPPGAPPGARPLGATKLGATAAPAMVPSLPAAARAEAVAAAAADLASLRAAIAGFQDCPLSATATNLVFSDGTPASGLVLIGDAPGPDEDRTGRPFVGEAGQRLDRMLASIGLDRTQVLLTTLLPWRPPGDRAPTPGEVETCLPFLHRHLTLLRPRHLVLLGALVTRALTGSTQGPRRLRGKWHPVRIAGLDQPVPALPMVNPALAFRTPAGKREAWADLLLLRRTLDEITNS